MNDHTYLSRVKKIQHNLQDHQLALISNPTDICYFSGFEVLVPEEREAFLIISKKKVILVHALFSSVDIPLSCQKKPGCSPQHLANLIHELAKKSSFTELLIDESSLVVTEYKPLTELSIKLNKLDRQLIWQARMSKDSDELLLLTQAGQIACQAFAQVVGDLEHEQLLLEPGITELQLKQKLEVALRELGSDKPAFPTIVAFGKHAALPHHQPTNQKLKKETPVLIDFGATVQGYRSDMTRTFWFGTKPSPEFQEVAQVIDDAYRAALAQINKTAQDIDQAARNTIDQAGFGSYFIHTTGHGVGLDIHEPPSLNNRNQTTIEPTMVITIEPGIYLPNKFGYRWENTFAVTKTGSRQLTLLP